MDPKSDLIKEEIDETRASLTEKLVDLETQLRDTVENAKETVEETLENVRGTFQKFSPVHQVRERPFAVVGGTMAAGYLVGRVLNARSARRGERFRDAKTPSFASPAPVAPSVVARPVEYASTETAFSESHRAFPPVRRSGGPTIMAKLAETFSGEIEMAKGMLLGVAIDALRKVASNALPDFRQEIDRVTNSAMRTVGADPQIHHFKSDEKSA